MSGEGVGTPDHEWPISIVGDASRNCVYGLLFPSSGLVRLNLSNMTTTHLGRPATFNKNPAYPARAMWVGTNGRVYFTVGQPGNNAGTGGSYNPTIYNKVWYWNPTSSTFGSEDTWTISNAAFEVKAEFTSPRIVYLMDDDFNLYKYEEGTSGTTFGLEGHLRGMTTEDIGKSWCMAVRPDRVHAYIFGSNGHFFRWNFNNPSAQRTFYGTVQAKDPFWATHFWFGGSCWDSTGAFYVTAFHRTDDNQNAKIVRIYPQDFTVSMQGAGGTSTGTTVGIRHTAALNGMWYWVIPDMEHGGKPHDAWSGCAISPVDGAVYMSGHDHVANSAMYAIGASGSSSPGGVIRYTAPGASGTVTGTYVARNESGLEATGTFTINVTGGAGPGPVVCRPDSKRTPKNTPVEIDVRDNDDNVDTVSVVTPAPNGTTTVIAGNTKLRFSPSTDFVGNVTGRYQGRRTLDGATAQSDYAVDVYLPTADGWGEGPRSGMPWWSGVNSDKTGLVAARNRPMDIDVVFTPATFNSSQYLDNGDGPFASVKAKCEEKPGTQWCWSHRWMPESGSGQHGAGWRAINAGTYDAGIARLAAKIAAFRADHPNLKVYRPVWEYNAVASYGHWVGDGPSGATAAQVRGAFRKVLEPIKNLNPDLQICVCPLKGNRANGTNTELLPDDELYDILGVDFYCRSMGAISNNADLDSWMGTSLSSRGSGTDADPRGLYRWANVAVTKGKKFACPEWGVVDPRVRVDGSISKADGIGDMPRAIELFHKCFTDIGSTMAFEVLSDYAEHRLAPSSFTDPDDKGTYTGPGMPLCRAEYLRTDRWGKAP